MTAVGTTVYWTDTKHGPCSGVVAELTSTGNELVATTRRGPVRLLLCQVHGFSPAKEARP